MALAYHPVRLFRLSCGCLRPYQMMPAGLVHDVLCSSCGKAAVTTAVYPERCCGAFGWAQAAGQRVKVSCTRGTGECDGALHFDECAGVGFAAQTPRLAASREGRTHRA
jgi:hypothetical protein